MITCQRVLQHRRSHVRSEGGGREEGERDGINEVSELSEELVVSISIVVVAKQCDHVHCNHTFISYRDRERERDR